jgi:small-conductance mechanosensitive channel
VLQGRKVKVKSVISFFSRKKVMELKQSERKHFFFSYTYIYIYFLAIYQLGKSMLMVTWKGIGVFLFSIFSSMFAYAMQYCTTLKGFDLTGSII